MNFDDFVVDVLGLDLSLMSASEKKNAEAAYAAYKSAQARPQQPTPTPTAKLFGGKALTGGSPKQREWAEEIRVEKLSSSISEKDAVALCDPRSLARGAVFWIGNRHRQPHEFAEFIRETRRLREAAELLQDKELSGKHAAKLPLTMAADREYREIASQYNLLTLRWGFH